MSGNDGAHSKAATIYDVARVAGVSHQTVSRLLKGYEGIRPETRQRVIDALAQLDYRPNQAARSLRTNRSNRIGALAHEMSETGPARIMQGAVSGARDAGYMLDIVSMDGDDERSIADALNLLSQQQIAGVFATAQNEKVQAALEGFPLSVPIFIDVRMESEFEGSPATVAEASGAIAAQHLVDLGHRNFAYLSGPIAWYSSRDRLSGFRSAAEVAGGVVTSLLEGDWSPESGYAAGLAFAADQGVTAIVAANDEMAIGLMRALADRGIRVPEEVSVIGFDDIPAARYLSPALSTVRIDFESEGRFAIRWLISEIEGIAPPAPNEIEPPRLIARDSTAPVRQ